METKYKDAIMNIKMVKRGSATHTYEVEIISGPFPSDSELITLCNGQISYFGGRVEKNNNKAIVYVYVD